MLKTKKLKSIVHSLMVMFLLLSVFNASASASTDPSILFEEDFNSGSTLTANSGTWAVEGGEYSQNSTGVYGANASISGQTFSDFILQVELKSMDSNSIWGGIHFRKTNPNDDYTTSGYLLIAENNGTVTLYRNGTYTLAIAATNINFYNTKVNVKIIAKGSRIKVYINNEPTPRIDVADSTYSSGYVSLNACASHWHFDNLVVQSLLEAPTDLIAYKNMTNVATEYTTGFSGGASDWTVNVGSWGVTGGEYIQSSTAHYNANATLTGRTFTNFILETDLRSITTSSNIWGGIAFRKSTQSDDYATGYLLFATPGGEVSLLKGGSTYLQTVDTGIDFNLSNVPVKIIADGSKIKVFFNHEVTPRISVMDTAYSSGYVSLNTCNSSWEFDNVSISTFSYTTTLDWSEVPEAAGYNLYMRANYASNGHYENLQYTKVNTSLLTSPTYQHSYSDVTYRVTSVYDNGTESGGSDMVFPIEHLGIEPLSIEHLSTSGSMLKSIPIGAMKVRINVINSLAAKNAILQSTVLKADGTVFNTYSSNITLTGDGKLHSYDLLLTGLTATAKSIQTVLYDTSMNPLSKTFYFKPLGTPLMDTFFEQGGVRVLNKVAPPVTADGDLTFGLSGGPPQWQVACWAYGCDWIDNGVVHPAATLSDGSITYANEGAKITRNPDGTLMTIELNGSEKYAYTRTYEQSWPNLLLEIDKDYWPGAPTDINISDANSLIYTADARMLKSENRTDGYVDDRHAGQYVMYFLIRGINGENMWFSLAGFESRYLEDEGRYTTTNMLDPGTNTFIIGLPYYNFWTGHLADGQWHTLSVDLKPLIEEAFNVGKTGGAFPTSSFSDLHLISTNNGFELPGTFDLEFQVRNFQLVVN